jgi:hypothetical protein
MRRLVLPLSLALAIAVPTFAQRLPQNVIPSNYKLRFVPDLAAEKFSGDETISVDVKKATKTVVLNAAEIEFDEVTITAAGKTQKADVNVDSANEMASFTVGTPLPVGAASIAIKFRGTLNDKLRGFYISHTSRRKYAVTQFEPTDARRAFPSFDEPAMKATYDLTLVVDKGDTAITNGKLAKDEPGPGPGKHTLTFERTQKMSTYLVAMLVGDWQCSEGGVDGIPIRICAVPEKKDLTKWAVSAAEAELHFYNSYYAFKYPFGKLDIIGIPDFEAGAMENAGAITFREPALLLDERTAAVPVPHRGQRQRARDRAHVVRRHGDDEVVERHLAERRLRHLDHEQAGRRVEAGVERARRGIRSDPRLARRRLDELDAADPLQRRHPRRDQSDVRRHRVWQDGRGAAHARVVRRRDRVPRRHPRVREKVRLLECTGRGLLGHDDVRHEAAHRPHHADVRDAGRRAARQRFRALRSGRDAAHARAAPHVRAPRAVPGRHAAALDDSGDGPQPR